MDLPVTLFVLLTQRFQERTPDQIEWATGVYFLASTQPTTDFTILNAYKKPQRLCRTDVLVVAEDQLKDAFDMFLNT